MNDRVLVAQMIAYIEETALKYGYSSQDNFTTAFRSYFGITPGELSKVETKYRRFIRTMREAYTIMEIANLKQPPLNTTLMGCIKGVADYFEKDLSDAMLFGLTGHAFLLNIHDELCPSGPYVWKKRRFFEALENIGIRRVEDVVVTKDTDETERRAAEDGLKRHLDEGRLCMLDFMEHQLVSGYDEKGLVMLLPWHGHADSEVGKITFGTWEECIGTEGWAAVTVLERGGGELDLPDATRTGVRIGLEIADHPERFEESGYHVGFRGYAAWRAALERGLGDSHGNWWNAQVWSECRAQAASFFKEVPELVEDVGAECAELRSIYDALGRHIARIGEKEVSAEDRIAACRSAEASEREAVPKLRDLIAAMS